MLRPIAFLLLCFAFLGVHVKGGGERELQSTLLLSSVLDDVIVPGCGLEFSEFEADITRSSLDSTISFDFSFTLVSSIIPGGICGLEDVPFLFDGQLSFFNVSLEETVVQVSGLSLTLESQAIGFIVPNSLVVPSFGECSQAVSVQIADNALPAQVAAGISIGFGQQLCQQIVSPLGEISSLVANNTFNELFPGRLPPSDIETQIVTGVQKALAILGNIGSFESIDNTRTEETINRIMSSVFVAPAVSGLLANIDTFQKAIDLVGESGVIALAAVANDLIVAIPDTFNLITGQDFFDAVISQEQFGKLLGAALGLAGQGDNPEAIATVIINIIEVFEIVLDVETKQIISALTSLVFDGLATGDFLGFLLNNTAELQAFIPDPQIAGSIPFLLNAFIYFQDNRDIEALLSNPVVQGLVPVDNNLIVLITFTQALIQASAQDLPIIFQINAESVSEALGIQPSSLFEFFFLIQNVQVSDDKFGTIFDGFQGLSDTTRNDILNLLLGGIEIVSDPFILLELTGIFNLLELFGIVDSYGYYDNNSTTYYNYTTSYYNYSTYNDYGGNNVTGSFGFNIGLFFTVGGVDSLIGSPFLSDLFSIVDSQAPIFQFPTLLLEAQISTIQEAFNDNAIVLGTLEIIAKRFPPFVPFESLSLGVVIETFQNEVLTGGNSDFNFVLSTFLDGALFEIIDFLVSNLLFGGFSGGYYDYYENNNSTNNEYYDNYYSGFGASNVTGGFLSFMLGVEDGKLVFPELLGLASDLIVSDFTFSVNVTLDTFSRSGSAFLFPTIELSVGNVLVGVEYQGQRLEIDSSLNVLAQQALLLFVDYTTLGNFGFGNVTSLPDFLTVAPDFADCTISTVAASIDAQNVFANFVLNSEFSVGNLTELLFLPAELASLANFVPLVAQTGDDLTEGAIENIVAELLFLFSPALPTVIELAPKLPLQQFPLFVEPSGLTACARNPFFVPEVDEETEDDSNDDSEDDDVDDDANDIPLEIVGPAAAGGLLVAAAAGYIAFSGGAVSAAAGAGTTVAAGAATQAGSAGVEGAAKAEAEAEIKAEAAAKAV